MASHPMVLPRAFVAVVAVLLATWFVASARQAHALIRATTLLEQSQHIAPAQARSVAALLRTAGELNPDSTIDRLRAQLLLEQGKRRRASELLLQVVRGEPMNAVAWQQLARTAISRTTYLQSLIALGKLAPIHLSG